jgi:hypothetical protein
METYLPMGGPGFGTGKHGRLQMAVDLCGASIQSGYMDLQKAVNRPSAVPIDFYPERCIIRS